MNVLWLARSSWTETSAIRGVERLFSGSPKLIVKVYDPAGLEAPFLDELEPQPHAIRDRLLAATDDDGRDEEFDFVDEARPEGVRRQLVATDHQVYAPPALLANTVDVERVRELRPQRRNRFSAANG
jgi:hypothetical protein